MRLWQLPDTLTEDICQAVWSLPTFEKRVENVSWNPMVMDVLALSFANTVKIFDVTQQQEIYG